MSAAELGSRYLVDSCSVEVEPRVQAGTERFTFPLAALGALGLELAMTERGFILTGRFTVHSLPFSSLVDGSIYHISLYHMFVFDFVHHFVKVCAKPLLCVALMKC